MAHKKAGGSSRNGRDSAGQRRGIKRFGGQAVRAGFPRGGEQQDRGGGGGVAQNSEKAFHGVFLTV